jgi:hypothetical protein
MIGDRGIYLPVAILVGRVMIKLDGEKLEYVSFDGAVRCAICGLGYVTAREICRHVISHEVINPTRNYDLYKAREQLKILYVVEEHELIIDDKSLEFKTLEVAQGRIFLLEKFCDDWIIYPTHVNADGAIVIGREHINIPSIELVINGEKVDYIGKEFCNKCMQRVEYNGKSVAKYAEKLVYHHYDHKFFNNSEPLDATTIFVNEAAVSFIIPERGMFDMIVPIAVYRNSTFLYYESFSVILRRLGGPDLSLNKSDITIQRITL